MVHVPIFSYNILSDALCTESYFPRNHAINLESGVRQARLLSEIGDFVQRGYILLLQEVSRHQWQWLSVYLEHWGYTAHWHSRCLRFDDYMGVLIAFPRKRYRALEVQYKYLEELKKSKRVKKVGYCHVALVIYLDVIGLDQRLWLGTTHLPAKPSMRKTRITYALALSRYLQVCAEESKCNAIIFTGDFNSVPYYLLEQDWKNALESLDLGFTVSSWNLKQPLPTQSVSDWILMFGQVQFESSMMDPSKYRKQEENIPLYPDSKHSSDHVPVHAILNVS